MDRGTATPRLSELVRALDSRWRTTEMLKTTVDALTVSLGLSIIGALLSGLVELPISLGRALIMVNGAAIVLGLVFAAARRANPIPRLLEADRALGYRELLASGFEFSHETDRPITDDERALRFTVVRRAEEAALSVDPATVYPVKPPRRIAVAGALAVALAILLILDTSGWFASPTVTLVEEGLLLEESGRRLAERTPDNDQLQSLAEEMRRLGQQLQSERINPDEAQRRIDELSERVQEQIRNVDRTGPVEADEEAQLPPEAEEAVRQALRSGMSEGEVMEFFTQMSQDGERPADSIRALEEATDGLAPDTNYDIDEERLRELMDQINPSTGEPVDQDVLDELQQAGEIVQHAGAGLSELSPGSEDSLSGERGTDQGGNEAAEQLDEGPEGSGDSTGGSGAPGDAAVADAMGDAFSRVEDGGVFRELQGIITDNSTMDVIIRELPSEAISQLSEEEREVAFERVIEEAIRRENTPPELQRLVRNYFLRITLAAEQGERDEQ